MVFEEQSFAERLNTQLLNDLMYKRFVNFAILFLFCLDVRGTTNLILEQLEDGENWFSTTRQY